MLEKLMMLQDFEGEMVGANWDVSDEERKKILKNKIRSRN
jgi:hypothetical protein